MALNWTRAELIVVIGALHANGWNSIRRSSSQESALSTLLRAGNFHPDEVKPDDFRSVGSVHAKVDNLRTHRHGYQGKPTKGGAIDLQVLAEYENPATRPSLLLEAERVRQALESSSAMNLPPSHGDEEAVWEGGQALKAHLERERARGLRGRKIRSAKADGVEIACEVCGFNFAKVYGERGIDFCEVHHRVPLHVTGRIGTRMSDLAFLCSNCHSMVHRKPWLTPEELAASIERHRGVGIAGT